MKERNIPYTRQQELPVKYKTTILDKTFRADIIMDDKFLVEIKSVESIEKFIIK